MKIMPIKFLILVSIIFTMMANTVNAGEFFYKTVHLGEQCSLSIPFLWKNKEVELNLPANIKPNIEAYQSLQLIGKEVIVTATYANFISRASICHIFNLGHGILQQTPVENVRSVVEMVHEWTTANGS